MAKPASPPLPSAGTKPRGLSLLLLVAAYFGLAAAVGAGIYGGSADGIAFEIGGAVGSLVIPMAIAFIVSNRRKSRVRLDIVFACSTIIFVASRSNDILLAYETQRFTRELRAVSPDKVRDTIEKSETVFAGALRSAFRLSDEHLAKTTRVLSEIDDAEFEHLLDPYRLADARWRAPMLLKLDGKISVIPEAQARLYVLTENLNSMAQEMITPGISEKARANLISGFTRGASDAHVLTLAYLKAMEAYLRTCAELIRYLNTPQGRSTLSSDGKLVFQTKAGFETFVVIASRIDASREAFVASMLALNAQRQRSLDGIRGLTN